jgi:pyrroloquinoline quinone biosynthesis protein B
MGLTAIVLGSAAGGGFPQWNCRCEVCRLAWAGDARVIPRTQTSVAVSADRKSWILLNAAPDLRAQIAATPMLHPRDGMRDTPIAAVMLTGAEIDQTAGLLTMRERQPFSLIATGETLAALAANPMFDALAPDIVERCAATLDRPFEVAGMTTELFAVAGKVPLYMERGTVETAQQTGVTVGIEIAAGGSRLVFVPGCAAVTPDLQRRLGRADVVFFDATLFADDEMIASGTGTKTGRRMGHIPIAGADGSLAALAGLGNRRVYLHINNTNPILIEGSPQRRSVEAAGWEVAADGLEIAL